MARKILIIVGDGGESYETLCANHRFKEEGFVPVVAAPSKRALNLVIHDFEPGWDTYIEKPGYKWSSDITFSEVKVADYEGVIVIGGRSPEYLRNDESVLNILREFDKQCDERMRRMHVVKAASIGPPYSYPPICRLDHANRSSGLGTGRIGVAQNHLEFAISLLVKTTLPDRIDLDRRWNNFGAAGDPAVWLSAPCFDPGGAFGCHAFERPDAQSQTMAESNQGCADHTFDHNRGNWRRVCGRLSG